VGEFLNLAKELCAKMTLKEKIGQIAQTVGGYRAYCRDGDDIVFNNEFCDTVKEFGGMGGLSGLLRADPWTKRDYNTGITLQMRQSAAAKLQNYLKNNTRLGIPTLIEIEASHGMQSLDSVSYPVNLCVGATFNPELFEEECAAIGKEIALSKNHVAFFTLLDLCRDPRWGRSEECFGEDTCLASALTAAATRGVKKGGALMCAKHFVGAGNCQGGKNIANVSVGENELMNFHIPVAKAAVDNGADFIMVAYNSFDGVPMHANRRYLTDVLKNDLKFDGVVISDGFGVNTAADMLGLSKAEAAKLCLNAGIHLSLGDGGNFAALEDEVLKGNLSEREIDQAVIKVLEKKFEIGLFKESEIDSVSDFLTSGSCEKLAYKTACEGIIMLKNNNVLPLKKDTKILLLGENADDIYFALGDYTSPKKEGLGTTVKEAFSDTFQNCVFEKGWSFGEESDTENVISKAKNCDVICLCLGGSSVRNFGAKYLDNGAVVESEAFMDCGEGCDVASLKLPQNQLNLLNELKKLNKPIISIVIAGRAYELTEVSEKSDGLILAFYPGQEGGSAIAHICSGKINPSGKLPVTLPSDSAALPVCYNSVTAIGGYVNCKNPVLYPFGFGLSYSRFEISNIKVTKQKVNLEIENKSEISGSEVIGVYIGLKSGPLKMPEKQLKAFKKVFLNAKEKKKIEIPIPVDSYCVWTAQSGFSEIHKKAKIYVGTDSTAQLICEIEI